MSDCEIRLVFTFPPKDSTLQYTSDRTFLAPWYSVTVRVVVFSRNLLFKKRYTQLVTVPFKPLSYQT